MPEAELRPRPAILLAGAAAVAVISFASLPWLVALASSVLGTLMIAGAEVDARTFLLPDTVMAELRTYLDARRSVGGPQDPQSGLFWHDQGNDRYTSAAIAGLLVDIIRRTDLKPRSGRTGPRVHDLRHSMVVNRILQWYRSGINPQDRLPFLATYLGVRRGKAR